jgi:hypothetical protein
MKAINVLFASVVAFSRLPAARSPQSAAELATPVLVLHGRNGSHTV